MLSPASRSWSAHSQIIILFDCLRGPEQDLKQKQKTVRVSDISLFDECARLLRGQLGQTLSEASIITAALTSLRREHTLQLISVADCRANAMPMAGEAVTHAIAILNEAHLIQSGEYVVEIGNEGKLLLLKDGEVITPKESPTAPDWVDSILDETRTKKQAVN